MQLDISILQYLAQFHDRWPKFDSAILFFTKGGHTTEVFFVSAGD